MSEFSQNSSHRTLQDTSSIYFVEANAKKAVLNRRPVRAERVAEGRWT